MDHDDRDRRDRPEDDTAERPPDRPDPSASSDDPSRAVPLDETTPDGSASTDAWGGASGSSEDTSAAEGWRNPEQPERVIEEPDQEAAEPSSADAAGTTEASADAGPPAEIESWPSSEPAQPEPEASRPWPTEPPPAGSGGEETWPTAAPERGEAPPPEPDWGSARQETTDDAGSTADDGWSSPSAADADERREPAPEELEAYPTAAAETPDAGASAAAPTAAHAVPDAEGTTGESTQCPRCGTENRPGLSFCRNCGQRLVAAGVASTVERPGTPEGTQACPRCGTHNRAGVAFCQNCGANLRGTAEGYVPPAAAAEEEHVAARPAAGGAVLGPVVLLIGLAGLVTGYLLPFLYGARTSLFDRAWGADGYGIAFWNGYPDVGASLADQAYFGLAGPIPLLGLLLVVLAVAGFMRAAPGPAQSIGLVVALLWSIGLIVLFVIVELLASWSGDVVGMLRDLTPGGIIFFLSSLIVLIGTLTRFSRG